jgi:hypothetical protein
MTQADRDIAFGITLAALYVGIGNLLPTRLRSGLESDGRKVVRWLVRPSAAREQIRLAVDLARLQAHPPPSRVRSRQPGPSGAKTSGLAIGLNLPYPCGYVTDWVR